MTTTKPKKELSGVERYFREITNGALGAIFAETLSIPFDCAKVTMFLQEGQDPRFRTVFGTMQTIASQKGVTALWAGVQAAWLRAFVFHGLKLGIYENFKYVICKEDEIINTPFLKKLACGVVSGAVGITFASPIEVVKVKM
jgi:solute carrier family 25 (mitochondrial uncoupling protein), member 8/9